MTAVTRPRSPLAHGPDDDCPSCTECPGCDGGSGATPKTYRVEQRGGALVVICTRCDGAGTTCLNLAKERG